MTSNYNIELVKFKIKKINIVSEISSSGHSKINANFKMSINEPLEPSDPTVLLGIDVSIGDDSDELEVKCSADIIFKFDPVPDNWESAVIENCPDLVRKKIIESIQQMLDAMGQPVQLNND